MKKNLGTHAAEKVVSVILSEEVLTVNDATKEINNLTGQRISRATLFRWIHSGRLEAVKTGRKLLTSREAIHRCIVASTASIPVGGK